ncbi:MAG: hypothetical protein Q7S22_02235 [Candidatus Micrarchaeota archaeon]|nr:hypothetical protein [Candidatus Micrarchaeota archaeon]
MAKPAQAFGGDDDSSGQLPPEQPKKLDLKRYASKPDANIRDIFWEIMASYAAKKPPTQEDFKPFESERHGLVKIGLSVIENPESGAYYDIGKNSVARFTLMMTIDGNWDDSFDEVIVSSFDKRKEPDKTITAALNKIYETDNYKEYIKEAFKIMIKEHNTLEAVIAYIKTMKNRDLIVYLKKELLIIAKGDVESNQYNAMIALADIKNEDEEIKNALIALVMHWDDETRKVAAMLLKGDNDPKISETAKRQLTMESNEEVKKLLTKLIKKDDAENINKTDKDKLM